jgi:GDP-L-fucose synthase
MKKDSRICVLGSRGLVGSALAKRLSDDGYSDISISPRSNTDLREQSQVRDFFERTKPELVFMAAGTVGGIVANSSRPAEFIYDNTMMAANVIEACRRSGVAKLMLLGSTCIYPRLAPQPIREECLLTGSLEETNEWYAIAKINAIKIGQAYRRQYGMDIISVMPTNLYGPRDNFDLESSHVLPALIRKIHDAKETNKEEVVIWGTGSPRREFLHVEDLVDALLFLMQHYSEEDIINVGSGRDISIADLAQLVTDKVGYRGRLTYDTSKPDGTPLKMSDSSKLFSLGWQGARDLGAGIEETYRWYLENVAERSPQACES